MLVLLLAAALADAAPKPVDWKALIPAVRCVLDSEFPRERADAQYPVTIFRTADLTGDGVPEALVWLGTGGASTDAMTVMRMEQDKPVVALFKERDGKIRTMILLRGASVMHGNSVDMLPNEHAIYSNNYSNNSEGKLDECGGEAYRWNSLTKIFEYNPRLSKKLTQQACRELRKTLP